MYTVPDIIKFTYVLPLTAVYFVSEVHCALNVLLSITPYYYAITYKCKGNSHITMIIVQSSTTCIVLLTCTCTYMYMYMYKQTWCKHLVQCLNYNFKHFLTKYIFPSFS